MRYETPERRDNERERRTDDTIYLTRHTQTTSNVMGVMQGWSDFPVTDEGREIIRSLGRGLRGITFVAAYCGNLSRHYETAKGALESSGNGGVVLRVDPDLREVNFGSFEGRDSVETFNATARFLGYDGAEEAYEKLGGRAGTVMIDGMHDLDFTAAGNPSLPDSFRAETSARVQERMRRALSAIGRTTSEAGGGNVLVVSSGWSIQQFLATVDAQIGRLDMDNAAVTRLIYQDGDFTIDGPVASLEYRQRGMR
ncbi:phosphoglycerate mutase family protein [Bifidobacterium bohemicum DSM 22767]|uniref:Phosphoglycerate mutase family protein n=1 Tax=Bifidobacterium bohemicum DSM 22767 TaxID=1437606 RepID=A0A086ZDY6_9BIFI|nr:histidine phosphatase family protein [Bifidobacterium bohemicum]KFI44736.1 phosphoglycerate mutase family protein [Bifidobacterium bohemicum DSM 22767]